MIKESQAQKTIMLCAGTYSALELAREINRFVINGELYYDGELNVFTFKAQPMALGSFRGKKKPCTISFNRCEEPGCTRRCRATRTRCHLHHRKLQ